MLSKRSIRIFYLDHAEGLSFLAHYAATWFCPYIQLLCAKIWYNAEIENFRRWYSNNRSYLSKDNVGPFFVCW